MLIQIPDVLSSEQVFYARKVLDEADWMDGRKTTGYQSAKVKNNMQIPDSHPAAREIGGMIVEALSKNPTFLAAAIPLKILPPYFNRYSGGQTFGMHVDNAIRQVPGTPHRIRTDLSATLFFRNPDEYEGGELCIEDTYGSQRVKLPAGHMVLYPSTSLHYVTPVTQGERVCAFFWLQSMIRDDAKRTILYDLDLAIQRLARDLPDHPSVDASNVQLTGVYHNLIRQWAEL